jgi:hypothetical protein
MSRLSLPIDRDDMMLRQCEVLRSVMNSTLFPLAIKDVKKTLLEDFVATDLEDVQIREMIWHQLQLLDSVVGRLRSYANLSIAVDERNKEQSHG